MDLSLDARALLSFPEAGLMKAGSWLGFSLVSRTLQTGNGQMQGALCDVRRQQDFAGILIVLPFSLSRPEDF